MGIIWFVKSGNLLIINVSMLNVIWAYQQSESCLAS